MIRTTRRGLLAAGIPLIALAFTACSGDSTSGHGASHSTTSSAASSAADHNQADVMFSMMMVPHHAQAVEMADLVPTRSQDPELLKLAEEIRGAQQPEIDTMSGWLEEWGAGTPTAMDHSGHMDGMMTEEDMTALEAASGPEFERMWLEMMVEHHEGAVTMSESVLADGSHPGTRQLAQQIIDAQRAEITRMRGMLAG